MTVYKIEPEKRNKISDIHGRKRVKGAHNDQIISIYAPVRYYTHKHHSSNAEYTQRSPKDCQHKIMKLYVWRINSPHVKVFTFVTILGSVVEVTERRLPQVSFTRCAIRSSDLLSLPGRRGKMNDVIRGYLKTLQWLQCCEFGEKINWMFLQIGLIRNRWSSLILIGN